MPKATDDDIKKVKLANPGTDLEVVVHPTLPHDFIVHGPSRAMWTIYRQKISNDAEKVYADDLLVDSCCVWPEKAERDALFEKYPGAVNVVAGEIVEIGGATKSATHRKL